MREKCRCGLYLPADGFCSRGCTGDRKAWKPWPQGLIEEPHEMKRPGLWPKRMAELRGKL